MGRKKTQGAEAPEVPAEGQQGGGNGNGERTKPAHEVRIGRIKGVVWKNEGKEGPWYSVAVSRSYKDGQDQWKQAHTFGRDDLLVVAEVCRLCWLFIAQQNGSKLDGGKPPESSGAGEEIPI